MDSFNLHEQKKNYEISVIKGDKEYFITEIIKSVKWGGDIRQAARKLDIEYNYHPDVNIAVGNMLVLRNDSNELFQGTVVTIGRKSDRNFTASAFDRMMYLLENEHEYIFRDVTATEIIKTICTDFGIPMGTIADTGIKISKLILRKKTLYDMMLIAITETKKLSGKKFSLKMKEGKLSLVEKIPKAKIWVLEEGANLLDASYEESIQDTKTQVRVVGKTKDKTPLVAVSQSTELKKLYGTMQEYIEHSEESTQEEITQIANQMLKELAKVSKTASVDAFGIDDIESGEAVYIIEKITGLVGTYYVESDDHTLSDGVHKMSLKLAWTDDIPTLEYQAPANEE